jgi:hypothetical protein
MRVLGGVERFKGLASLHMRARLHTPVWCTQRGSCGKRARGYDGLVCVAASGRCAPLAGSWCGRDSGQQGYVPTPPAQCVPSYASLARVLTSSRRALVAPYPCCFGAGTRKAGGGGHANDRPSCAPPPPTHNHYHYRHCPSPTPGPAAPLPGHDEADVDPGPAAPHAVVHVKNHGALPAGEGRPAAMRAGHRNERACWPGAVRLPRASPCRAVQCMRACACDWDCACVPGPPNAPPHPL